MRRGALVILGALAALACVLSSLVVFAPRAGAIQGSDCAATQFRLLFWPRGHKAIEKYRFPRFPVPHLEVYTGTGKKFPDDQNVAYADGTAANVVEPPGCQLTDFEPTQGSLNRTVKKTKQLVCTFDASPVLLSGTVKGGGAALGFYVNGSSAAYVSFTPEGSKMQFDSKQCKVKKPPR